MIRCGKESVKIRERPKAACRGRRREVALVFLVVVKNFFQSNFLKRLTTILPL